MIILLYTLENVLPILLMIFLKCFTSNKNPARPILKTKSRAGALSTCTLHIHIKGSDASELLWKNRTRVLRYCFRMHNFYAFYELFVCYNVVIYFGLYLKWFIMHCMTYKTKTALTLKGFRSVTLTIIRITNSAKDYTVFLYFSQVLVGR